MTGEADASGLKRAAAARRRTAEVDAIRALSAADPQLAEFIARAGPLSERPGQGDAFSSLARAIVFQQLAGRAAAAIHGRFVDVDRRRGDADALLGAHARRAARGGPVDRQDARRSSTWPRRSPTAPCRSTSIEATRRRRDRRPADHRPRHRPLDGRDVPALRAAPARRLAGRRPRRAQRLQPDPRVAGHDYAAALEAKASATGRSAAPPRCTAGRPCT